MRYLVLTDIHANLEALDACLVDARSRGYDKTLVLGDLVGYGADPNAVIERIRSLKPTAVVRGNHDKVASGLEQAEGFNAVAFGHRVTFRRDDGRRARPAGSSGKTKRILGMDQYRTSLPSREL